MPTIIQTDVSILKRLVRGLPRPQRLLDQLQAPSEEWADNPSAVLAYTIEQARVEGSGTRPPPEKTGTPGLKKAFVHALAALVRDALREEGGDPAFQAMVLRHQDTAVREFASLSASAEADRRAVRNVVNKFAHPAKQQRCTDPHLRETMARLHGAASHHDWALLAETAALLRTSSTQTASVTETPPLAETDTQAWAANLLALDSLPRLQRKSAVAHGRWRIPPQS